MSGRVTFASIEFEFKPAWINAMTSRSDRVEAAYKLAREVYLELGIDPDQAMSRLEQVAVSLHCWQGDDVRGFENLGEAIGGGLAVTGNYPGRARTADELRADFEQALRLIPGRHRFNLHASYAETGSNNVDRNEISPEHFQGWIDWAQAQKISLDFNPTLFAHPKAADGYTLAHADAGIRSFWVEHAIACRTIAAAMGKSQGSPCVTNVWIPDGSKDTPVDRKGPRERLTQSLDTIFSERLDSHDIRDAVEGKLFGLGSESYVVGSHEFYLGYAITRRKLLCLDAGHFHPTESIADKISAVLNYMDEILLHVSRGVRWDSDHVVILNDDLCAIAQEIVRTGALAKVRIGLDFFDASINRVAAWVIGTRALLKALLLALLEPIELLRGFEASNDYTARLGLLEELKSLPFGAVWDQYCLKQGVAQGTELMAQIKTYEQNVQALRS